jgi:transposase
LGRPSKLTPEVQQTIVNAIGLGASYADAAQAAGVSYDTFNEWMKNGTGKYLQFSEAVRKEQAAAVLRHLAVINNAAAKGDWKASERWLRMYRPQEWQETTKLDINQTGVTKVIIEYVDSEDTTTETPHSTIADQATEEAV